MAGPDDTPVPSREGADDGLVWVEGGEDRPFEDATATMRPWLEVSVEWNAPSDQGDRPRPGADGDDDDDGLVWL